jgi:hypothetical protein
MKLGLERGLGHIGDMGSVEWNEVVNTTISFACFLGQAAFDCGECFTPSTSSLMSKCNRCEHICERCDKMKQDRTRSAIVCNDSVLFRKPVGCLDSACEWAFLPFGFHPRFKTISPPVIFLSFHNPQPTPHASHLTLHTSHFSSFLPFCELISPITSIAAS